MSALDVLNRSGLAMLVEPPVASRPHYTGFILSRLRRAAAAAAGDDAVTIENHQVNGAHGVHQARVRLAGDAAVYRLILAPVDAPLQVNGRPIGEHFTLPLGDA